MAFRSSFGRWLFVCVFCLVSPSLPGEELPLLGDIQIIGDPPFSERKVRTLLAIKPGDPFSPEVVQAASDRLMEACRNEAYPLARVTWRGVTNENESSINLIFQVDAGLQGRLVRVQIVGNQVFSNEQIIDVLSVRPVSGLWNRFTGGDLLLLENLSDDQENILRLYHESGYYDAQIGAPDLRWLDDEQGFLLIWPIIDEGPIYRIGLIDWEGLAQNDPLRWQIGLESGEIARSADLREATDSLRELLLSSGYAMSSVALETEWNEDEAVVDLRFRIRKGNRMVLRAIHLEGNRFTRDSLLIRELFLYPGQVFNPQAFMYSEEALMRLGVFEEVKIRYTGDPDGEEFDVWVELQEKPTGRVEGGLSWGSVEGPALLVNLLERNFSLRPPFRGGLLDAGLSFTVGPEILRGEAGLRNPRVNGSSWGLGGNLYYEYNRFISDFYNQRTLGSSIVATYPLTLSQTIGVGFGYTAFQLEDLDPRLEEDVFAQERNVNLTALLLSWDFNRWDRDFRPSRGIRIVQDFRIGTKTLGGNTEIFESRSRFAYHMNPIWEHVFTLRGGMTQVLPIASTEYVPLPLRTWLGGPANLRGFKYRSVSPLNAEGVPDGAEASWWGGLEYMVPLLTRLDFAIYTEAGDTSDSAWTFKGDGMVSDWGIGFLIRAENFPVRFDVAFPITVREGDTENQPGKALISFSGAYVF